MHNYKCGNKKMSANILWLSDSPMSVTGYATITFNICNKLAEAGHNVYCIGHNYIGQPVKPGLEFTDGTKLKFTILGGSPKPYAMDLIQPYIKKYKIDIFAVLLDTFMLYPWFLNLDFSPAKTIFYFPSDGGGGMPLGCENILRKVNCPVAMAKFGQRQVKECYGIDTKYIPHAIDIKNYFPVSKEEKEKLKAKWGLQGKFVVGVVQRNQGRKMPDRMIKSFAIFAKTHPDAILFCHTDPYDVAAPVDLMQLINRYKLNNRVMFSGMNFFNGFDYKEMNNVYNLFDVFFLTTSGEGFGIPTIEAMACGVPPVVTDYTTTQELLIEDGVCGIPVKVASELTGSWNVERAIMDDDDGAKALETLYNSPELREQYGKVGVEKSNKLYNWDDVGKQWCDLMEELVK
jgi:glycosyltransferase involved in cell wall biosynthesis